MLSQMYFFIDSPLKIPIDFPPQCAFSKDKVTQLFSGGEE